MRYYTDNNCANSVANKVFYYDNKLADMIRCNLIPLNNIFNGINSQHTFLLLKYNVQNNLYDTFAYLSFKCGKILGTITDTNAIDVYGYGDNKKKMKVGEPFWYYEFDDAKTILITKHTNRGGIGTDTGTKQNPPDVMY